MVTLGLGVLGAGIYGVAVGVAWFWDCSFWHLCTTPAGSLITLTWIRSTTRTTSRSAFPKSPMAENDAQKGEHIWDAVPSLAHHFLMRRLYFFILLFLFLYTHSVWRMLLPFLPFWLLALNLGHTRLTLSFPSNPQMSG